MWEDIQIRWRPTDGPVATKDIGSNHLGPGVPPEGVRGGREPEWLVANGIGGFASGGVFGIHRRRYHGWLTASLHPPVQRRLLWAKNDEWLFLSDRRVPLASNDYGDVIHPDGWRHIHSFSLYPFPTTRFFVEGVALERTIFMVHGQNTTVALYRLLQGNGDVELHIEPLVNCRDYHHTSRARDMFAQRPWETGAALQCNSCGVELFLGAACADANASRSGSGDPAVAYTVEPTWYYNFHYAMERARGLDDEEDHFRPGVFRWRPRGPGDALAVIGHCPRPEAADHPPWRRGNSTLFRWAAERRDEAVARRRARLGTAADASGRPLSPTEARLHLAADDFVVRRATTGGTTLLAGYPWFTDWGRDAMISLPGLLLTSGRRREAKDVLLTFAAHRTEGLIPNRFPDDGVEPLYNTVDASLWFVWAADQYGRMTGDAATVERELLPVMEDIVAHYLKGTRHGIGVDGDGLVVASDPGLQLTWMDAKAGNWVVTPRAGVPVEINALWYNALRTVETLARKHRGGSGTPYGRLARRVRRAFLRRFVLPEGGLLDVASPRWPGGGGTGGASSNGSAGGSSDDALRCNQLFAAALPFAVLPRPLARKVVGEAVRHLLTPVGLRTLAPTHPAYIGQYGGDQTRRDGAYHQGTVWPWLLGAFVDGARRTGFCRPGDSPSGDAPEALLLDGLIAHMETEAALGHVSEIFAGDPPHGPRGCFAQAWSTAEWLRILHRPRGEGFTCWPES